ncbi:hypothetical protein [Nocardia sp. R7R-8]|uniref:hypothetical protein n=1 Tax=Nocardia sp. R7R-8 TaxID=3459304 RepID=UPI00403DD6DF
MRRYVKMAQSCGMGRDGGIEQSTDELLTKVITGVRRARPNARSEAWEAVAAQSEQIKQ